jgi:malate/lactate dehydrogenase
VSEIVLLDVRRNLAEAHAIDIEQAVVHRSTTRLRAGDAEDTAGSDVVLMTASVPKRDVEISRREYLAVNLPIALGTIEPIVGLSPDALWIVASSPVDPLVYLVRQVFRLRRDRVIGLSRNDSARFRWAIARALSVPSTAVEAFVLGEHGETQVPIFSEIRINGEPVTLKPEQIDRVRSELDGFFVKWNQLQAGRTAGWTSAESIGDMVFSMVAQDERVWPCSNCLDGEYGLKEVSLGVPVRFGTAGVKEIVEFALEPTERRAVEASATAIREMIKDGEALLEDRKQ